MSDDPDIARRMELAREGATMLYQQGAGRVWLFGSLARRHKPDAHSDIDFAVEGLPYGAQAAVAATLGRALGCPVDVVPMDHASPQLRAGIMRARVLLPRERRIVRSSATRPRA